MPLSFSLAKLSPSATMSDKGSQAKWLLPVLPVLASAAAWAAVLGGFSIAEQNFPLNDDWAFARGAMLFARGKGIHYSSWASMPQLGQWLWACPFVWSFGESFFALRLSTIVLSWLGLWAFFDILRQEGIEPWTAALCTTALALNPLFFLLQGTFMTDVPALSMALVALALYSRALKSGHWPSLALATLVATLAVVTRQNTVTVPVAMGVLVVRDRRLRLSKPWYLALGVPAAIGVAFHFFWFQKRPDIRPMHPTVPPPELLLLMPFAILHLCGLATLPALALAPRPTSWRSFALACVVLGLAAIYWLHFGFMLPYGGLFPYMENMISPWGAFHGSATTGLLVVGEFPRVLDRDTQVVLSVAGCVCAAVLATKLIACCRSPETFGPLSLFTLLQLPLILIAGEFYDRYLLVLFPGALFLARRGNSASGWRWPVATAALVASALVAAVLMHDWLAWNAARWAVGTRALEKQIDPWQIEGGFEWNGWFGPGSRGVARPTGLAGRTLPFTQRVFPHVNGHWALASSVPPGTRAVDKEPYTLWSMPGKRFFYLVEVEGAATPSKGPADASSPGSPPARGLDPCAQP
jgi:4-amino-4-deoxy-L-arabinose transferase-like glycosyltransferase